MISAMGGEDGSLTISIVTPSFNQGLFLGTAMQSVLMQDYPGLEYIVIDGGSTDGSVDIIKEKERHLRYWVSEKDEGQAHAIAKGFSISRGQVLGWLNSDDLLLPGCLAAVAKTFSDNPDVGVVYGNRLLINEAGKQVGRQTPPFFIPSTSWSLGQLLCQESVFWRRTAYDDAGGIDPSWFFIMDFDLFYRLSRITRFRKIRKYLGCLRLHGATKSSMHDAVLWREFEQLKARYGIPSHGRFLSGATRFLSRQLSRFERLTSSSLPRSAFEEWNRRLGRPFAAVPSARARSTESSAIHE